MSDNLKLETMEAMLRDMELARRDPMQVVLRGMNSFPHFSLAGALAASEMRGRRRTITRPKPTGPTKKRAKVKAGRKARLKMQRRLSPSPCSRGVL